MTQLEENVRELREGAMKLSVTSDEVRKNALHAIASSLSDRKDEIKRENAIDIENARKNGISDSILHRLVFTDEKIASAIKGLEELALLPDPIGKVREKRELDPGFILEKRTFPIGVIAMIFEARPDALVQIAGLALRSGNAVVLKGGKEAQRSNAILTKIIKEATEPIVGAHWILGIESHEDVNTLLTLEDYIDLIIPRGSNKFVRFVMDNTRIPVIGHSDGICSVYVDKDADLDKALRIAVDSKIQYPAACNAAETILVHKNVYETFLPRLSEEFIRHGVKVHADERACPLMKDSVPAVPEDWDTEYLALECAVKVVDSLDEAISHIAAHSSHHTDAIVSENKDAINRFFAEVDSADVFSNCSTRFADGFRFGLGAEVGISTSKIHARGPVGLDGLMTTKWLLSGNGEIVADYSGPDAKSFHHKELPNA